MLDNLIWFTGWACIAVPLWMVMFGLYWLIGLILKSNTHLSGGKRNDFSRN